VNPTEMTASEFRVSDYYRKVNAELAELAAKYPPPTLDDVRPEWMWVHERGAADGIDPEGKFWGLHVAIYQQKIVGAGPEPTALQIRLSRELNIHPERLITVYLGEI
jgi:hypothetical protein